ncbi:unnamed protein product [Lactuca saligna]|uniref:Ubiquitin-like protease family profile domain-containing protein n=1 Tax=Lactuca saligna TaxID=75948 RepID=A0AA35VSW3_LACSI|nr:unnamed protein product [Lactuca saligna]
MSGDRRMLDGQSCHHHFLVDLRCSSGQEVQQEIRLTHWMDVNLGWKLTVFRLFGAVKIIDFVRFEELMDCILVEIEYWNHMGLPVQEASITVTDVTGVPQQEGMYRECGVFMLMFMDQFVSGRLIGISMAPVVAATQFRYRMAMIYYGSSIQSILS